MKNREIKFRAFDTKRKRMFAVYGLGKEFATEDTLDGVDPGYNAFQGEDFKQLEIMQFIGLKDRYLKDIYEGYILSSLINDICYNFEVRYFEQAFRHYQIGYNYNYTPTPINKNDIDKYETIVIGNIHENPELLNG